MIFLTRFDELGFEELSRGAGQAEALRAYAKNRRLSVNAQNECAILRIELERRIGELLRDREMNKGAVEKSTTQPFDYEPPLTLAELGYDKEQSRKFQLFAYIPQRKLTEYYELATHGSQLITDAEVIRMAKEFKNASLKTSAGPYEVAPGKKLKSIHVHLFVCTSCGAEMGQAE